MLGEADRAIQEYETAIGYCPDDASRASCYEQIARLRAKAKLLDDAIANWRKALELGPGDSSCALSLVDAFFAAGRPIPQEDFDHAIASCRRDPNRGRGHYRAGVIYFRKAELAGPSDRAALYEHALSEHDEAVRNDPKNADYQNSLGLTYRRLERWEMAFSCYERSVELAPDRADYRRNLGLACQAHGLWEKALPQLEWVLEQTPHDEDCRLSAAECYAFGPSRDVDRAIAISRAIIAEQPKNAKAVEAFGRYLERSGNFKESLVQYDLAFSLAESPAQKIKMLEDLKRVSSDAVAAEPESARVHQEKGEVCYRAGEYDEALESYQRALKLDTSGAPAFRSDTERTLGNIFYKKAQYQDAIEHWEEAIRVASSGLNPETRAMIENNIGTAYDGLGNHEEAGKRYSIASGLAHNKYAVHYNLGTAFYRRDHIRRALSEFQEAFRLSPELAMAAYHIGNCYWRLDFADLAEEKWHRALEINAELAEAEFNLGVAAFTRDEKNVSLQRWQKALAINPALEEAARGLEALGHPDDAPKVGICELPRDTTEKAEAAVPPDPVSAPSPAQPVPDNYAVPAGTPA